VVILVELIVACGSQRQAAGAPTSRVTGTVAAGPIAPVARPGEANTRPVRGATIKALRGTRLVAVTRTDQIGRYTLTVPPGTYVILVTTPKYLTKRTSKTVSVAPGQTLKVGFVIDTGIR